MSYAEWATAFFELLIAFVIFLELEENRRDNFLREAAHIDHYEDRRKIYSAFYETQGQSVAERSTTFCDSIWKPETQIGQLRSSCEKEIVLFNRLGQIHRHAWLFKGDYVKLFPHAVVLFWIMIEPYIQERRGMTGKWWANAKLILYDSDRKRKKDFVIPTLELRRLEERLGS